MCELSVIIPARNEKFLQNTVDDILRNFCTDFEIIVGLDDYDPDPPLTPHDRVRVYRADTRIGMRAMINTMAQMARGRFIMKVDAHCSFDKGYDEKLMQTHRTGYTVLGVRYLLDTPTWKRRERTNCDFRYLSHPDVDRKGGLRGTAWNELKERYKDHDVAPTMTISGSGWMMEKSQFEEWEGLDNDNYGTMGQEGAEISLKTWLSGGKVLVDRRTWYAHWNRGKSPYAIGRHQVRKSVKYSCDLWINDKWPRQTHSFWWLIEKFAPVPGWTLPTYKRLKAPRQGTLLKGYREKSPYRSENTDMPVQRLWDNWMGICEPLKKHRLSIMRTSFIKLLEEEDDTQYRLYLKTHLPDVDRYPLTTKGAKHVNHMVRNGRQLYADIKENGLRAPLEFYNDDNRLVLWKGYRRLIIAHLLGMETIPCVIHKSDKCKMRPPLFPPCQPGSITDIAATQFSKLGGLATDKYWVHGYTYIYDQLLQLVRNDKLKILELGVHRGASLLLWREAFRRATIYGVDKDDSKWRALAGDLHRVNVMIGNQRDPEFLKQVAEHGPFDVIIDDCSHDPKVQEATFKSLWPHVSEHGKYIIEDCHYSYQKRRHNFLHTLIPWIDRIYTDHRIGAVQYFYNLTAIQKWGK